MHIIVTLLFLFFFLPTYSQANASMDSYTNYQNSAILGKIFLEVCGEDSVSKILSNDEFYMFDLKEDTLGNVLKIVEVRKSVVENRKRVARKMPNDFIGVFENYFQSHHVRFTIVLGRCPDVKMSLNEIIARYYKELGYINTAVSFPYYLMIPYRSEGGGKSKLDYLKERIAKYYPKESRFSDHILNKQ